MGDPTIDVLLAVYNGERFLRAFLESLAAQSFRDFRLVVSDNRSSDGTAAILEEYRERLGIVVLPAPGEVVSAQANFARVTEAAAAPYVMYADADDVWHDDKIEKTFAAMKQAVRKFGAAAPILVHADLSVVDENLACLDRSFWRYQFIDPDRTRLNHLLMQNCVTGCTAMLNRPLLELGRPIPREACVHDHWYALIASAFGHIVRIEEPLIEYRQHGGNVTGAKRWGASYMMRRAGRLYGEHGARENIDLNIRQARALLSRFDGRLDRAQRQLIENFATIRAQGALMRRWKLVRYGLWKTGFARNFGLVLAI
ncbi:MAG TPA: glycosyltransferase family 2 protein [Rhizomicrobium sp.]|jgi:glycosyltransferase involved in cell wall biosynthesis